MFTPVTASTEQHALATWLRDLLRPKADGDFFDRLAGHVASSAPPACGSCA